MALDRIEDIIEDIRQGKMVILMDDEDRENEGDLIMAASAVRAEDINFMAKNGRGLICLTLTRDRCRQLKLPLMVQDNTAQFSTKFTVSIEAAKGVTTGISAADRAVTIQAAVAANARPDDLVQPGHVFPIVAQPGGVLTRAGHTEAGCDLARMAGLEPASVIVEILNEDGTMARRPDLEIFAEQHGLRIGTIADLIRYRLETEQTVECVGKSRLQNEYGDFCLYAYKTLINDHVHFALVKGEVQPNAPTLVRVHMHNFYCDVLHSGRADCGWPLSRAMQRISSEGNGIIVILEEETPQTLVERLNHYRMQDDGEEIPHSEAKSDLRTYGIGAQILADLGVRQMRVLSAPKKIHGLSGFGLEVVEYVPCD